MKISIKNIKYILPAILIFSVSCGLSTDYTDAMKEYNTNSDISISGSLAADAFYNNDKFTVVCTPSDPVFTVKYTTDGTDPSRTAGTEYTAPITIQSPAFTTGTIEIRAVAYDANRISGIVNTFVIIGDGLTGTTPFDIATPAQLENMSLKVNDGTHSNSNFRQIADIDLSTYNISGGWVPIGNSTNNFRGSYNGADLIIDNLFIDRSSTSNQGLFGYVAGNAILGNIKLSNANVTGFNNTGALAGYINGSTVTIFDCDITATSVVNGSTNVGGLIGYVSGANVTDSDATVTAAGASDNIGGLIGYSENTALTGCSSTATVTGQSYVGGLVGVNANGGTITASSSASAVSGQSNVGGLAGVNTTNGEIINNSTPTTGSVTATGVLSNIGGLVGYNAGTIWGSETECSVTALTSTNVGGFVGQNSGSGAEIFSTRAEGEVQGGNYTGGFVGINTSSGLINTWNTAAGNVTGGNNTGGFAGSNQSGGVINQNNHSEGSVTGADNTGGFVGYNTEPIDINNYATGIVTGEDNVGGFVGINSAAITRCWHITGSVTGTANCVGGFAGVNETSAGIITNCYSNSVVLGFEIVGGLVGYNFNTARIESSSARIPGTVTGNEFVGGLVGINNLASAAIRNSYARVSVHSLSSNNGGGLVGNTTNTSIVYRCYSTGEVSGLSATINGLTGFDDGTGANTELYWDTATTLQATSGISVGTATAETIPANFGTPWDYATVWFKNPIINGGYPYLQWESL